MENTTILDANVLQEKENKVLPRHLAGAGKRFLNYIIDVIVFYAILFVFGLFIGALGGANLGMLELYLFTFLVMIGYYWIMESTTGKTVGKIITKTRVVDENFAKPSSGTIFLRTLCRFIPFEPFSMLGSDARGWHDSIMKVYVIDETSLS